MSRGENNQKKNGDLKNDELEDKDIDVEKDTKKNEKKENISKVEKQTRDLGGLLPSQMTREEMLFLVKKNKLTVGAIASNQELRTAIRDHRDNGKKTGPTL